jgi:hypothetical protein
MITTKEYETCLKRLQANNGKGIRLPEAEIISRLQQVIRSGRGIRLMPLKDRSIKSFRNL